nr:MAG TPA: hypothetical protein [Caudoviricetes sp.]
MTISFNFRILLLFIVYLLCDSLITEKSGYFGTWIFFCKKKVQLFRTNRLHITR